MGRKIHPYGFRVGVTKDWQSRWYAPHTTYAEFTIQDQKLREYLGKELSEAGVSRFHIERQAASTAVTIFTSKPGIVIGRQGQNIEQLRNSLQSQIGSRVNVNVEEIRVPELDAYLVAKSVAMSLERRVAFRRAMKQSVQRTMARGAIGCKIKISGRLGGAEMSRSEHEMQGRIPLHTFRADIDYGFAEANTSLGLIGVKCWVNKGEVSPEDNPLVRAAEETGGE